jgi:hypothetical protein
MYPKPVSGRLGGIPEGDEHPFPGERCGDGDVRRERRRVADEVIRGEHDQHRVVAVPLANLDRRHGESRSGVAAEGLQHDGAGHGARAVLVAGPEQVLMVRHL